MFSSIKETTLGLYCQRLPCTACHRLVYSNVHLLRGWVHLRLLKVLYSVYEYCKGYPKNRERSQVSDLFLFCRATRWGRFCQSLRGRKAIFDQLYQAYRQVYCCLLVHVDVVSRLRNVQLSRRETVFFFSLLRPEQTDGLASLFHTFSARWVMFRYDIIGASSIFAVSILALSGGSKSSEFHVPHLCWTSSDLMSFLCLSLISLAWDRWYSDHSNSISHVFCLLDQ